MSNVMSRIKNVSSLDLSNTGTVHVHVCSDVSIIVYMYYCTCLYIVMFYNNVYF